MSISLGCFETGYSDLKQYRIWETHKFPKTHDKINCNASKPYSIFWEDDCKIESLTLLINKTNNKIE